MRNPHDEALGSPTSSDRRGKRGTASAADEAVRKCILTGDRAPREALVRLALALDGAVLPDVRAKAPGRGAWIGVTRAELETAIKKGKLKGALARAFKTGPIAIPGDLPERLTTALERATLDRLGLESRSGTLLTGSEKIETAARSGQLHLLLHACDAGADGNRKLDQAWRVGRDAEGSDLRGLVLPVPRTILAVALGRQNVVHIGLTERNAAARVEEALHRWLHFLGPDPILSSCETASQGASASQHDAEAEISGPEPDADTTLRGI